MSGTKYAIHTLFAWVGIARDFVWVDIFGKFFLPSNSKLRSWTARWNSSASKLPSDSLLDELPETKNKMLLKALSSAL